MHGLHFPETRVTRQSAQDTQPQFIQQWQYMPEFTGNIVFTDQINIVYLEVIALNRKWIRITCTDNVFNHGVTGNAVAQILGAGKSRAIDRHDRNAPAFLCRFAYGVNILAH